MSHELTLPRVVYSGAGALSHLEDLAKGKKKVAVFTDKGIRAAGLTDQATYFLCQGGAEVVIYDEISPEPTYLQVQNLMDRFYSNQFEWIVAIGGGSVLDTAKLASLLASGSKTVKDLLEDPTLGVKTVPVCAIPTTAGTGAEATPNAIVAVPEKALKVGIVNRNMIPDCVILDPEMIRNLPHNIAAATGVDAMAHAIECFTSKKANPFSDFFALEAFDMILNHILPACNDSDALEDKNKMQLAAFYAGIAICCSGTTAVHALSYPLGGRYHIPHGVSNAILLLPVMKFNEPVIRDRLAVAYDRVVHGERNCLSDREKSAWVLEKMEEIIRKLEIPTDLSDYHVSRQNLENLVQAGMQVTRLLENNMRQVTAEDARKIYLEILT